MSQVVNDADFEAEVLKSSLPVIIDFWAPWCGPCRVMSPLLDELATEFDGKVRVVKMNVDENPEVPGKYGVMSIPTFIIFKNGEMVDSFVGSRPKDDVKKRLEAAAA